ncbi:GNAT family N-acetyltransferase [Allorhizobium sp. BGMRC 0089]|uniref:GNAT family N-acetyltransferase n=1 Tax=Allorhizobium sonneratiae TaxID=2934936 RepID=UPI0020342875|nr:GNAT family N-acetyltransferase [Allorhizobium sonneratiae]MCM2294294.1 GNAT family N-acetyltransferase [Allorhizobium sonneratiae]
MATIRTAHAEDAQRLADIGFRAWEKAMIPVGETISMADNARRAFRNFTQSSALSITVIEHLGQPVGWAARENLDDRISDFWIDPDYQGRGYSRALLAAIEKDIIGQGYEMAQLETHARNRQAIGFFEHHGYRVHWLSVVYNPKFDRDIETVGMSKRLVEDTALTYGRGGAFE